MIPRKKLATGQLKRYRGFLFALLALLLATGLGTAWFLSNFERKERVIQDRFSLAARQNPLLAATRLLQGLGRDAQSSSGRELLVNLPPAGDALLLYRQTGMLSPSGFDDLHDWIEAGGHLIITPQYTLDNDEMPYRDDMAAILADVRRRNLADGAPCGCGNEDEDVPADNDQAAGSASPEPDQEPAPEGVSLTLDDTSVQLNFSQYRYLEEGKIPATFRIDRESGEGAYLLQYRKGRGKLTILLENTLFNNRRIGRYDHGWLLNWLVRDDHKIWLLYAGNRDGIFTLLRRNLPRFLIACIGLLLFTVWYWQYRIGPFRHSTTSPRRNVLTHIDALGRFSWELDQAASLVDQIREQSRIYWQRRMPGKGQRDNRVDPAVVASLTGLDVTIIENALYRKVVTEQDIIIVSRCLQQLENRQAVSV